MTKENENVPVVNKSSYTQEEINAAYEKGKNEGRIEGMLAYQKRLIDNPNEKIRMKRYYDINGKVKR